ncbi:tetratricopeptide repeat protein [Murinocardiopsis flavida]|uniref:Tetratricopeptide repeat protein n=1 Tax=Murinocardiopsis flavida TaxID=645275 RepID=A0A2P8DIT7_9ACTN|nr:tetratricopeptide repeat protein [Murinocardiopsis flavida]PSK97111.1 tetratricopeptide repeat protein [Murinocardiopsis flavida]
MTPRRGPFGDGSADGRRDPGRTPDPTAQPPHGGTGTGNPRDPGNPSNTGNAVRGAVHGTLLQARDIHGEVHLHSAPPPAALDDVHLDPPRPTTDTRGRTALLDDLADAMDAGGSRPHVLAGPGGIGKSTVAAELAHRAAARGRTVFWVRTGNVLASMLEVAVELGAPRAEAEQLFPTPGRAARWVWRHLAAAPVPWLLVFDNIDRPAELAPTRTLAEGLDWLRGDPAGFVLVTTRVGDAAVWAPAVLHEVAPLNAESAAAVLADHAGAAGSAGASDLADRLGGYPLALALAGRILATHRTLFQDCHALLAHIDGAVSRLDALTLPLDDAHGAGRSRRLLSGAWELSLELIPPEQAPEAAPLLRLLSVLGPDGAAVPLARLPVGLLRGGSVDAGDRTLDEPAVARALNALVVHGLVELTGLGGTGGTGRGDAGGPGGGGRGPGLRVHPLIGESVRAGLGDRAAATADDAVRLLEAQPGRDPALEHAAYLAVRDLRSHALGPVHADTLTAEVRRARLTLQRGDSARAYAELSTVAAEAERALGAEHRVTLTARHHAGDALLAGGRLDEAVAQFRSVLDARTRISGPDHPDTLSARHQLALIAVKRGDWDTAETELRLLLAVWERRAETEDQSALFTRQNLAYVDLRKGRNTAAEAGFRRVLAARERLLGADHPATLDVHYYLALTALERGDLPAARSGFASVAHAMGEVLGPDHPDTRLARARLAEAE